MLHVAQRALAAVIAHATEAYPNEACGIIAGPAQQVAGGPVAALRHVPMRNAAGEPDSTFAFAAGEQMAAYAEMDTRGEDPVVLYHSHPRGPADPSPVDLQAAAGGSCLWLIVSLRGSQPPDLVVTDMRCWRILDGRPSEVKIRVSG